ncbi:filamentous hemagglutinin N-terminal domain-containing protein [Massilia agilis]|uniref:Filamentous hemagglutinin N-terminal domain-containing protein n=1 Tax=Massilia agilis TaxID=1811226 RepID=A0ABT2D8P3_9BURK|nr:filamentous hemagglutinin N-terminal domain-containing protein [Massilia agilis]MCS0807214.1 filamentous hemagglutinin N-terminal domain-containing protein [Massilia agilis]
MTTTTIKRRLVPLLLAACFGAAVAAPTGQQVVAGQATFSQQGNVFSITNTPGTIINWQSFSINPGEITRFIQQGADSAVLNRIVGQDPSRILGALQSNGKVFLINPNGILFGRDARVDVNGLVATTLNLSNADFLAGKKNFSAGPTAGEVRNEGAITTPSGGQVFLVAPNVTNSGIITSPQGDVVLAAGHSVQLVDSRDPDLHVVVSAPDDQAINLGQVVAQGGRVGIYGALVNQRGLVSANSAVVGENGKIVLKASRDTLLEQGSVTSATGAGKGGDVHLLGARVGLTGNAQVDASGAQGGGNVMVGGGWQGKDVLLSDASQTWMGKDARIKADATSQGNGGQVVLWSNDATGAYGSISARGGALGGDGGKVETSGHSLDVNGLAVNAGAAKGKSGSWLLDPYDIEVVSAGATATPADVATFGSGPASGVAKIAPSVLQGTGTNIMLQAQNDLTITDALSGSADVTGYANHNINVNANVSANGSVLFAAGNGINLNSAAKISSQNYVDLIADQMTLAGNIGGISGRDPVISFASHTPSRQIVVGSGTANGSSLWLDAAALARFSAYELNIGTSANTGGVNISSALNTSAHLSLDSSGPIAVNAPVSLGSSSNFLATLHGNRGTILDMAGPVTAGAVYLTGDGLRISKPITANTVKAMPHSPDAPITLGQLGEGTFGLDQSMLGQIDTADLTIGGLPGFFAGLSVSSALDLSSHTFGKLTLDAGGAALALSAPLTMPSGVLSLKSNLAVAQGEAGALNVDQLVVKGNYVALMAPNTINKVAGASTAGPFMLNTAGDVHVGDVGGMSGISASTSGLRITSGGALTLDRTLSAPESFVSLQAAGIGGAGTIRAGQLDMYSTNGVGSASASLNTEVSVLRVSNNQTGSKPVNIRNTGDLIVWGAYQSSASDSDNSGSLAIAATGTMTVPKISSSPSLSATAMMSSPGDGRVHTESGNISLTAQSGMTIGGEVSTKSGNIDLKVTSGAIEVHDGALVASVSGDITVAATSSTIATGAFQAAPGKLHLPSGSSGTPPPSPTPPTLDQCVANPAVDGCAALLEDARKTCAANPTGANCTAVMPKIDECKANPSATGCDVVIKQDQVQQCVANPTGASCSSSADYCAANPTFPGCAALNDKRGQIDACIANPKGAGCSVVLPTFDVCTAKPDTYGCAIVVKEHDKVAACAKTPGDPACASVLPSPDVCKNDASVFGCTAVLERLKFVACVGNPNGAGCDAILPPLDVCKTDKTREGCGAVIGKTFDYCLGSPGDPRCVGVLPTISQCVSDKTVAGCPAVLPTMTQCIASPTLQGCGVILPKLEVCAVNPNQQGCEAVLPKPDFCASHPNDASCVVFNPNPTTGSTEKEKAPVADAVQTTVTLINSSTQGKTSPATGGGSGAPATPPAAGGGSSGSDADKPSEKQSDKQSGPAGSENNGAKNEKPATKTYCN